SAFLARSVVLKRVKLGALIAVVAAAALLPLYGDPRNAPVTHAEWARMLLRGLKMEEAARQATTASQAFAILSWKGSLSLRADRAAQMGWVDAGRVHLDPGAYTASVLLPRGTALEHVEVAPPCLSPIEPPGGWKAADVLLSEDAAVTIVQALDRESELPPAAS